MIELEIELAQTIEVANSYLHDETVNDAETRGVYSGQRQMAQRIKDLIRCSK